jgi:hypothetical protein
LAVYAAWFPVGTVFFCVVDPGVGGALSRHQESILPLQLSKGVKMRIPFSDASRFAIIQTGS